MRILIAVILTVFSLSAQAEKPGPGECRGNCPTTGGGSHSEANAGAVALSGSKASNRTNVKQHQTTDVDSTSTGIGKASNGDQKLNVTDSSSTTNINDSDYVIPAHADAGVAFAMLQGCYGIGGVDARGSGPTTAGGLTLNIFKLTNNRCVLAAKALEAQANGNLNGYATLTCADKATWKGYRTVMRATSDDRRISKNQAIVACVDEIKTVALNLQARIDILEATVNVHTDDDLRKRVNILEDAAHNPDSKVNHLKGEHY